MVITRLARRCSTLYSLPGDTHTQKTPSFYFIFVFFEPLTGLKIPFWTIPVVCDISSLLGTNFYPSKGFCSGEAPFWWCRGSACLWLVTVGIGPPLSKELLWTALFSHPGAPWTRRGEVQREGSSQILIPISAIYFSNFRPENCIWYQIMWFFSQKMWIHFKHHRRQVLSLLGIKLGLVSTSLVQADFQISATNMIKKKRIG